jgi:hypothetical protein
MDIPRGLELSATLLTELDQRRQIRELERTGYDATSFRQALRLSHLDDREVIDLSIRQEALARLLLSRNDRWGRIFDENDFLDGIELLTPDTMKRIGHSVEDAPMLRACAAATGLILAEELYDEAAGSLHLGRLSLCASQRFHDQLAIAWDSEARSPGTGWLVGADLLVTARHVIADGGADLVVFGYDDRYAPPVPADNVRRIAEVVVMGNDKLGEDWALVRLESPVPEERVPRELSTAGTPADQQLFTFGHPMGLPLKYAGIFRVAYDPPDSAYFLAPIDALSGSSGSPVFDRSDGRVVGLVAISPPDNKPIAHADHELACRIWKHTQLADLKSWGLTRVVRASRFAHAVESALAA